MLQLNEQLYEDYRFEYHNLAANKTLLEKYPEMSGCWAKDLRKFIEIRLKEDGKIKEEQIQEQKPIQKNVVWKNQQEP